MSNEILNSSTFTPQAIPDKIDLSNYLGYIRAQGGDGCWAYSMLAMWDILNEMCCPNSPNLSANIWLFLHRRRNLWEQTKFIMSPDGRYHPCNFEHGFFQSYGITTEGTEPTCPTQNWTASGFTDEGTNEAENYRLKTDLVNIPVNATSFQQQLSDKNPIRVSISSNDFGHVIAFIGYDSTEQKFKYINSWGDAWGDHGYGYVTFSEVNNRSFLLDGSQVTIDSAETINIIPPKQVPIVKINFSHNTNRNNVELKLLVEGSPHGGRYLWPCIDSGYDSGWSKTLNYKVRVPSEFIWPPSPSNKLILKLKDTNRFSGVGGGVLNELYSAFGNYVINTVKNKDGIVNFPFKFEANKEYEFYIE